MTRESIETILSIWDDPKPGVYESDFWRFTIPEPLDEFGLRFHLTPYQKPHPPIGVAGVSPKSDTLALAGERGWIPMSINLVPSRILKTHWDAVSEGAETAGRTANRAEWRIAREIYVAETSEQARREALDGVLRRDFERYFLRLMPKMGMLDLLKTDPNMADSDVDAEYLVDNVFIVGGVEEAAEKLNALHNEVGGFGVLLAMGHEWVPYDSWTRSMELLVNEVAPRVGV